MASVLLRACVLIPRKQCLQEFVTLGRSVTCFTRNSINIKKFIPALQVKHFSTEEKKESERIVVYEGTLRTRLRNLRAFSLITSAFAFTCQPFIYIKSMEHDILPLIIGFGVVGIFAVGTPLMLHMIAKKYVTHLYYYPKENKYCAETYTLFLKKKKTYFTANDVEVPDITGMFTSCFVKGTPVFLHEKDFSDATHYFTIMGYYKPIDFKLSNVKEMKSIKETAEPLEIENKR